MGVIKGLNVVISLTLQKQLKWKLPKEKKALCDFPSKNKENAYKVTCILSFTKTCDSRLNHFLEKRNKDIIRQHTCNIHIYG